ncbi:MAG: VIT family protein [Actinobacteria bacterium]|jgi:VIT1/CCC1 family predicted Fe2+/Mn2+ transporter|nr:VIT family protein [Actinomycetota bacterium]
MERHDEGHFSHRIGLLRAMVLGANDGIISTACLILGVAAADAERGTIITAGIAALVAGAASMAIGEYVSVSSQRDSEQADIAKEMWELEHTPEHELDELTAIYKGKGLTQELARAVAIQLTKEDALKVHMAEELGISQLTLARPVQASVSSALSFSVGAAIPLIAVSVASASQRITTTVLVALLTLVALGLASSKAGGAQPLKPTLRVLVGGAIAMAFTMAVGSLVGGVVL